MTKPDTITRSKGKARREMIVAAARRALLDDGYAGFSLRSIASALGISVGNLQYYFPTKDSLVETVINGEIDTSLALLQDVSWECEARRECLDKAVRTLLHHHAGEAGRFYAIAEYLALHDQRYARLKAASYARVFDDVQLLVAFMAPTLAPDRGARLAQVVVALIDGASLQVQMAPPEARGDDVDALASDVVIAIERLLEAWA